MQQDTFSTILLRLGLSFAFLYPAVSSLVNPDSWMGFLPEWIGVLMPVSTALILFSIFEIIVGVGVLFMKNPTVPAGAIIATLLIIIAINWRAFDIVFRDVSIVAMAWALIVLKMEKESGIL